MAAMVGEAAIEFSLPDTDGVTRWLGEFHRLGPLVLLFIPTAYGWRPRWQLWSLLRYYDRFVQLATEVVIVTADPLPELRIFQIRRGFPFVFLSDRNGKTAAAYGPRIREQEAAALVIDTSGVIRYYRRVRWGWRTSAPRLLRAVTGLKASERVPQIMGG